jgi:hypothetical protein
LDLENEYANKFRVLDEERGRIKFSVSDVSSALDLKSIVMREEELGPNFKVIRHRGFAIPNVITENWIGRETNEFEIIKEVAGQEAVAEASSDKDDLKKLWEAAKKMPLYAFESPDISKS